MQSRRVMVATVVGAVAVVLAGAGVALRDARTSDGSRTSETLIPDGNLASSEAPATTIAAFESDKGGVREQAPAMDMAGADDFGVGAVGSGSAGAPPARDVASPYGQSPPPVPGQQQVIKTADIRLELARDGFRRAFDQASAAATSVGGFVVNSSSERVNERLAAGTLVLRVPADRFDGVRAKLAGLGTVEQESIQGTDVSGQLVDLDARLRSMRAQEDVLVLLMGKAKTVGETIEVQQQLSGVRMQIEQMAAEQARLKDAVALSTITVSMAEKGAALARPANEKTGLSRSFERAWDGAIAVLGGTIVVLGYGVPLSLLGLAVFLVVRTVLRRRRSPVAEAPAPAAG